MRSTVHALHAFFDQTRPMDLANSEIRLNKCIGKVLDHGISIFTADQVTVSIEFINQLTIIVRGHSFETVKSNIVSGTVLIHTFGQLEYSFASPLDDESVNNFIACLVAIPHRFACHRVDIGDHLQVGFNPFDRSNL